MPATPKVDTSPANVARVPREAHATLLGTLLYGTKEHPTLPSRIRALADALEQQGVSDPVRGALTWEERVEIVARGLYDVTDGYSPLSRPWLAMTHREREHYRSGTRAALRKGFPELAPTDD